MLPFDDVPEAPGEPDAPDATGTAEDAVEATYSVAALNDAIHTAVSRAFPPQVWVRGEIAQLRTSGNGHAYFDLCEKDERRGHVKARISVALFRDQRSVVNRTLRDAGVRLADGIEVRLRAKVDFYRQGGRLQLVMQQIDPLFTVGKLAADRARVLAALQADGTLQRQRALAFPMVPLRVGLVTSRSSAAYHDFVDELRATPFAFEIVAVDVRVQGQGADRRLIYGLQRLRDEPVDVIAVIRGGGARSDLASFDSERLARLIADTPVPVITGIGHEVDRTIADEVAHTCAKTPTAAAGVLIAAVEAYRVRLSQLAHRLSGRARQACRDATNDVDDLAHRIVRRAPLAIDGERRALEGSRRRVAELARRRLATADRHAHAHAGRLRAAGRGALRAETRRIAAADDRLRALDPRRVLERGYSITRTGDGRVVRGPADVGVGDALTTETVGGLVHSSVVDGSTTDTQEATPS